MVARIGQKRRQFRRTYFRQWREFRSLTQEQLAERLGTTKSAVSKVERGENRYNQTNLEAWAAALGCEPWDLISRSPDQEDFDSLYRNSTPDIQKLIGTILKNSLS